MSFSHLLLLDLGGNWLMKLLAWFLETISSFMQRKWNGSKVGGHWAMV